MLRILLSTRFQKRYTLSSFDFETTEGTSVSYYDYFSRDIDSVPFEETEVVDVAEISEEALELKDAYLATGIVTEQSADDALHVAIASVNGCSLIVSWNFRHIVHFEKIPLYNAVNTLKGYGTIGIFSPLEVITHET